MTSEVSAFWGGEGVVECIVVAMCDEGLCVMVGHRAEHGWNQVPGIIFGRSPLVTYFCRIALPPPNGYTAS